MEVNYGNNRSILDRIDAELTEYGMAYVSNIHDIMRDYCAEYEDSEAPEDEEAGDEEES